MARTVAAEAALVGALSILSGCDPMVSRRFNRMLDLFETVLYATFACCGFFFLVLFIGNLVALGYNIVRPTRVSRLSGFGFGVPHAAIGLLVGLAGVIEPPRHANPDSSTFSTVGGEIDWVGLLVGLGISGLFTLFGVGSIVAAVFAGPRIDAQDAK
ncbi:MAG: hypothetical protein AB8I08_15490 [Sandaracinaceae bacterium]